MSDWTGVAVKSLASIVNSVEYIILYTRSLSALVLQWPSGVTSALWGEGVEDDAIGCIYYGCRVHADLACNISERRAGRVLYIIIYDNIIAYAKCDNIIFRSESKSAA